MNLNNILLLSIGFGGYMLLMFYSRKIQTNTFSTLDGDSKKKVFEAFAPFRKFSMIPAFGILIVYLVILKFTRFTGILTQIGFGVTYLSYLIASILYIRNKLIKIDIPSNVVFKIIYALSIQYLGMILVILAMVVYFIIK